MESDRVSVLCGAIGILATIGCAGGETGEYTDVELPEWRIEEVARIGSLDDPDIGLTRVSRVLFGPNDRVYISQSSEREIRIYEKSGTEVRRFGRNGEGPGEFRSLGAIGFTHDTLYVADMGLRRFSMFTPDGEYIESFQWQSTADQAMVGSVFTIPTPPQIVLDDGTGLLQQGFGYRPGDVDVLAVPWLRIDREGTMQDTIAIQETDVSRGRMVSEGGPEIAMFPPIGDAPLYQLMADRSGLVMVERPFATDGGRHTFRMRWVGPAGDTLRVRDYDYAPVPLPQGEAERLIEQAVERYADSPIPIPRATIERTYGEPGFIPDFLPTVSRIRTGDDGSVWIQRETVGQETVAWNMIDTEGELLGTIRLPATANIMAARGFLIAALEMDEFDVPYVVIYRVVRDPETNAE
ncbi:MAG TPA: hypothetical protein VMM79_19495 [Longimicrobiales bacterium]|nr:hypothetical protein [Longimicrobiales bacterium]